MTGLYIHRSHRLEALAGVLVEQLSDRNNLPDDPMQPVTVLVGSRGMERWLAHQLADGLRICAAVSFQFAQRVLRDLLALGDDGPPPDPDPWDPAALTWTVLAVLQDIPDDPAWERVGRYLSARPDAVDRRRYALARELAELLDRYAYFRRDWVDAWTAGRQPDALADTPDAVWQADLWRHVRERLAAREVGASTFGERLAALERRLPSLSDAELAPHRLHVFGLTALPPAHLAVLDRVASRVRIDLYQLAPSHHWYGDYRTPRELARDLRRRDRADAVDELRTLQAVQNPLLASFGRVSRDFQVVCADEATHAVDGEELWSTPPSHHDALAVLQRSVLDAEGPPDTPAPLPADDHSIVVHSAHGPTRQVEVLRDQLLHLLQADPTLQPRDIVVMVPDIDMWAPLVSIVFEQGDPFPVDRGPLPWAGHGAPKLPFQLSDLTARATNPVADALLRVLDLADGRLSASALLDLLALEPIRTRFELSADDVAMLRDVIADVGFRWGLDAADRARFDLPSDPTWTLAFACQRLALGTTMADDGGLWEGLAPWDQAEGDGVVRLGRLIEASRRLGAALRDLDQPRTVHGWRDHLLALLDGLTATEESSAWLSVQTADAIRGLAADAEPSGFEGDVDLGAIRLALMGRFGSSEKGDRPINGAISVCALKPMRSVPFRVVCLLGMDEGAFPRDPRDLGFDLTDRCPRLGDREPGDEDRHLFLEAILSARERLVIVYGGRSAQTNESVPPCTPVLELFDAMARWFRPTTADSLREQLTRQHPLQPFSPRNFRSDGPGGGAWSFDPRLRAGARRLLQPDRSPATLPLDELPEQPVETVDLDALIAFLRHPVRAFLKDRLGAWLGELEDPIEDREPLELDGLSRWKLEGELTEVRAGGAEVARDPTLAGLGARGRLPVGAAGIVAFDEADTTARVAASTVGDLLVDAESVAVDLEIGGRRLVGDVPRVSGHTVVDIGADDPERPVRLLRAWVRLLALAAARDRSTDAHLGGVDKKKGAPKVIRLGLGDSGDAGARARGHLGALLDLYAEGHRKPLLLFRKTSHAWQEALVNAPEKARANAAKKWLGGHGYPGEADQPEHAAFHAGLPFDDSPDTPFAVLSAALWTPILAALDEATDR